MNKKLKILWALVGVVAILLILIYAYTFIWGEYITPEFVLLNDVKVDAEGILLSGSAVSSATGYSGYKLIVEDDTLYVKLRYSVVSPFNPTVQFRLFKNGNFSDIKRLYLLGPKKEDVRLIWIKNNEK